MSKCKEVNSKKFDAIMAKSINLENCPRCGRYGGQIIIDMPMHGRNGVYCKCYQCGFETRRNVMNITMVDRENKRMGTPVIDRSLMSAIHNAVNDWNRRANDGKREIV